MLRRAGFTCDTKRGKGSHSIWEHPLLPYPVNLAGKDGNNAQPYQDKDVRNALRELQQLQEENTDETL